ncbi:acetolactate synthase large subunit [Rhodophyticola sp. CCM32]|uniref:acetolactate synthase large subunit n=1 Tax=Rhodophyticola sp. CCM32 TaxID=2916397 RepID=UPI00107FCE39|nr:acetolactate synthase large subunit [Rhodophyticola sp. CCM32]QBY02401.1 acetolactate synthase large subunit [Rhodophyticola sp. CCM32]
MNGAESLVTTFLQSGVEVCFANPGTSEMHFVAALDQHPDMRCVLCLFEGGASGAADGYYRMTGRVAATMLHLAPGFGNAYANLHNARKAGSGIVNVMGDHATHHMRHESPLKGDTAGISAAISQWARSAQSAGDVARDGAAAITAARSRGGQIATLILPADTAWGEAEGPVVAADPPALHHPSPDQIASAAAVLTGGNAALLISGPALCEPLLTRAGQIAAATGAQLMSPLQVPRLSRGADRAQVALQPYVVEQNLAAHATLEAVVLCGAHPPVNFFAYPGKPSVPTPPGCAIHDLCLPGMDVGWVLEALADHLGLAQDAPFDAAALDLPDLPTGAMDLDKIADAITALLPEQAIVVNEAVTSAAPILTATETARAHDLLVTTGGAIGQCLPVATGAAVACPDRPVIAMSGDGSAMYTLQSLWTMARERLDVTVLIFANRGYQILRGELTNVGVESVGRNAIRMLDVDDPLLDWVALAEGHGVPGRRATTTDAFVEAMQEALATPGPHLIEIVL